MEEIINTIAEGINMLADTINDSKFVGGRSKISIKTPVIGMRLGECKNCRNDVELRQPWSSEDPVVTDGWYLVHCKNERCHNYAGIEVMDFVHLSRRITYELSVVTRAGISVFALFYLRNVSHVIRFFFFHTKEII